MKTPIVSWTSKNKSGNSILRIQYRFGEVQKHIWCFFTNKRLMPYFGFQTVVQSEMDKLKK